jgi:hypothetical protein
MSYDLAVFEPRAELRTRPAFLTWFRERTSWNWGRDYSDPANAAVALQSWYREVIQTFPPLNGPDRPENMDPCAADYSIGPDIIYVAISGDRTADAYETMLRLASRHSVGFFNASGNGEAWFPGSTGQLELIHQHQEGDPPGRMSKMIEEAIARHGALHVNTIQDALAKIASDPSGLKPIVVSGAPDGNSKGSS